MTDTLDLIEQRINTLENLVGSSENIDQTKGFETIRDISKNITNYLSENSKIANYCNNLTDIEKYTDFNALNEIEDEDLLNAKIELILDEEANIKRMNKNFENLKNLANVLDNKNLNDMPSLLENLKDLSGNHAILKVDEEAYSMEIKQFLSSYFNSMQLISETMENLNSYLD